MAVGADSSGSIQQHFGVGAVLALPTVARSLDDQADIVREVQSARLELHEAETRLNASVGLLNEYKRSLITAAVTGEFDVTTARTGVPA
jgi:type I restriction enzyme S subunit